LQSDRLISFDFTTFDSKSHSFKSFVESLVAVSNEPPFFRFDFEPVLRYASFPSLDKHFGITKTYEYEEPEEIFKVLNWLRDTKKVQKIIELKVLDRPDDSHDEEGIAEQAEKFEVEILNWRLLDFDIRTLTASSKLQSSLREFHLYFSGRRSTKRQWLSLEGLKSLDQNSFTALKLVHIHIIEV
jgi:hypothetical protein